MTDTKITASVGPAMRDTGEPTAAPADALRHEQSAGLNQAMRVLSYLIAGVAFYGFLGWLGDRLLGTGFLLPVGIILGAGLAVYLIFRYLATEGARTGSPLSTLRPAQHANRPTGTREGTP